MFKVGDRVWNTLFKQHDIIVDTPEKVDEIIGIQPYEFYELKTKDNNTYYEYEKHLHETAQTMFEELGYEKRDKVYGKRNASWYETIEFYNNYYTHTEWHEDEEETRAVPTTIEEHLAIHQQMIELGWIE